jgi:hypothetical protein
LCTTRASGEKFREGGVRIPVERSGSGYQSYVPGPDDPLTPGSGGELRVKFEIAPDKNGRKARISVDSQSFTLKIGEFSEWVPVKFKAGVGFSAHGICRFFLKDFSPEVESTSRR